MKTIGTGTCRKLLASACLALAATAAWTGVGDVRITGSPLCVPGPDYSTVTGLAEGDGHQFVSPLHPEGVDNVTCTGYRIYDVNPQTGALTLVLDKSTAGTTCEYVHGTSERVFEWVWSVPEISIANGQTIADLQAAVDRYPYALVKVAAGDYVRTEAAVALTITNAIALVGQGQGPYDTKLRIRSGSGNGGSSGNATQDDKDKAHSIVVNNGKAVIRNVLISNNNSSGNGANAALVLQAGLVENCIISNCNGVQSSGYRCNGGGVRLLGGTLRRSTVVDCQRPRYAGGGIYMEGSSSLIDSCRIVRCKDNYQSSGLGGGVYAKAGTIRNSLIAGCSASSNGSGVYIVGPVLVENCTIADCTSTGTSCAGLYVSDKAVVRNTIAWNCTYSSGTATKDITVSGTKATVEYCDSNPQMDVTKGNISQDPTFDANYRLNGSSGCVDGAQELSWMTPFSDLGGEARIKGDAPDMGCFERDVSTELECRIESTTLVGDVDSGTATLVAGVDGTIGTPTFSWYLTDEQGTLKFAIENQTENQTVVENLGPAVYTIRLVVRDGDRQPVEKTKEKAFRIRASVAYANSCGSGVVPYADAAHGAPDFETALDTVADGGTLYVAPGTYDVSNRIYLAEGRHVAIRSTEGPSVTILQATIGGDIQSMERDMVCLQTSGAELDGLTLTMARGAKSLGGDKFQHMVVMTSAGATVTNCVVRDIDADYNIGGIGLTMSAGKVLRTVIKNVSGSSSGGSGSPGGIGISISGGLIDGCVVSNISHTGGGLMVARGVAVKMTGGEVRNTLIEGSSSSICEAVYVSGAGQLNNCTIVKNRNTGEYNTGRLCAGLAVDSSAVIQNVLVATNMTTGVGETNVAASASATIRNCFVSTKDFENGENCLFGNPKFKRAAKDAWRLRSSSAAINAGLCLDWMEGATDLDGNPRVRNKVPDIGCYEGEQRGFMIVVDGSAMGPNTDPDPIVEPKPVEPQPGGDAGGGALDPGTDPTQDEPSGPAQDEPSGPAQDEPSGPVQDVPSGPVHDDPLNPPANATVPTLVAVAGLSADEQSFYEEVVHRFDYVNPLDGETGRRKYISFGFITDEHSCKRIDGDNAATNPDKQYWYYFGGTLTQCDPSIRLLGAVSGHVGLDAVFNGGDFSTGNSLTSLTSAEYLANVQGVKAICNQYLPTTPVFTVDGNHDRSYAANATYGTDGHYWNDGEWRTALEAFNSDVSQNAEIDLTMHRDLAHPTVGADTPGVYTGNCYHVDFKRLMPQGKPNVRFIFVSEYDSTPGNGTLLRQYDGFQFYDTATQQLLDPTKAPSNTLIGVIAHGKLGDLSTAAGLYLNAGNRYGSSTQHASLNSNLGLHKGLGYIGSVAGHAHQTLVKDAYVSGVVTSACVQVNTCYSDLRKTLTRSSYCFSIFTVDTDRKKLIETRVVGGKVKNYESDIVWNAGAN